MDSNALFVSYYLPKSALTTIEACRAIMKNAVSFSQFVFDKTEVKFRYPGEPQFDMKDGVFTRHVYVYCEDNLREVEQQTLNAEAKSLGMSIVVRGLAYAVRRSEREKPLAFVCHDSRDKGDFARPIAKQLQIWQCPVWFDEFSLNIGDSLRENVERGIKESQKCILVLSPHFLANSGWTKTEFNAIFTKGIFEKNDVLLPVWCGVSHEQVYNYSPTLADRKAANWESGCEEVCRQLLRAIRR